MKVYNGHVLNENSAYKTSSMLFHQFTTQSHRLVIAGLALTGLGFLTMPAGAQTVNSRVTTTVNVEIPVVVKLSGVDNITTVQSLNLNAKNITFDPNLTASGRTFVTWRGNTNSNNGFQVTIQRSVISGTANSALQSDIMVTGQSFPGGDTDVVVASPYIDGVALSKVSDTIPDLFCTTKGPGAANFNVQLSITAPSTDGLGTVSAILTFLASAL